MIGAYNRDGQRKPAPWEMTFDYFDKLGTSYGTSTPSKFGTREQAIAAMENASRDHNGGGIVVTRARAYPTTGWFRQLRTRSFNFPSRYNRS